MKPSRGATQNVSKFKAPSQYIKNWSSVLLISILLLVISCSNDNDLGPIFNESPIDNQYPIAYPGENQTITLPTNFVNLDGSGSSDPVNPIISYSWSKISGPTTYSFTNENAVQTQVINLVEGVYQFELTVTNALGLSGKGIVSIKVIQNMTSTYGSNKDINLMLPQDWVVLNNSYIGSSSDVTGFAWEKINGPATYSLGYSNFEYTVIYDLVEGSYQFELTVDYVNGSVSKDTTNVNLYDVSTIPQNAKEIVLYNQNWIYPWYPEVQIENFYSLIPSESLFRIFIRRDGNTNWEDVPGSSTSSSQSSLYDYFIERRLPDGAGMYTNGSLYITYYGPTPDTPDIKIVYW